MTDECKYPVEIDWVQRQRKRVWFFITLIAGSFLAFIIAVISGASYAGDMRSDVDQVQENHKECKAALAKHDDTDTEFREDVLQRLSGVETNLGFINKDMDRIEGKLDDLLSR